MNLVQFYETEISLNEELAARVVSIPARSCRGLDFVENFDNFLEMLDLEFVERIEPGRFLRATVVALQAQRIADLDNWRNSNIVSREFRSPLTEVYSLAEYLVSTPTIPFERNPLEGQALLKLATVSGVGTGAVVGYVAAAGTPFILITVPTGMILCGAAAGVGAALESGLKERIRQMLRNKSN